MQSILCMMSFIWVPCKQAAGKVTWPLREFVFVIGLAGNTKSTQ